MWIGQVTGLDRFLSNARRISRRVFNTLPATGTQGYLGNDAR